MRDAEDEAFDELAKRQGDWGGGFQAKRKMAADKLQEPVHSVQSNGRHSPLLTHMMNKRTALAQPAQEPTGMLHIDRLGQWLDASLKERKQREWVGLTDDALANLWYRQSLDWMEFARAVEQLLKEQNFD